MTEEKSELREAREEIEALRVENEELRSRIKTLEEARDTLDRLVEKRGKRLDRMHNERALLAHLLADLKAWARAVDDTEAAVYHRERVWRRLVAVMTEEEET